MLGHANINYEFENAHDQIGVGVTILQQGIRKGRNLTGSMIRTEAWLKNNPNPSISPPGQESFDSSAQNNRPATNVSNNYTTSVLLSARETLNELKRKGGSNQDDDDLFVDDDDADTKVIIIKSPYK